jgi:hypothetical protein
MRAPGLALLPLFLSSPILAQAPHALLGFGVEAAHIRDNRTWTPGVAAQLGVEFPLSSERLALRLESGFYARDRYAFTGSLVSSVTHAAAALRLNLATAAFRPYVLVGLSYQRFMAFRSSPDGVGGFLRTGEAYYGAAGVFGVGVDRRVAGVRAFIEARTFVYAAPPAPRYLVPVTVGVSF